MLMFVDGKIVFVEKLQRLMTGKDLRLFFQLILSQRKLPRPPQLSSGAATKPVAQVVDSDQDGVADADDACPRNTTGAKVDSRGCLDIEHRLSV